MSSDDSRPGRRRDRLPGGRRGGAGARPRELPRAGPVLRRRGRRPGVGGPAVRSGAGAGNRFRRRRADGGPAAPYRGSAADDVLRRLRGDRGAGPRRHGGRLQGAAHETEPAGGPEDDPCRGPRRRRAQGAIPGRGAGGGSPPAPAHRPDPRNRRTRRPALLLAGIRRGRQPGRAAEGVTPLGQGGGAARRGRWPAPSTTPTSAASSTATSSRRTCCSRRTGRQRSPTSASPDSSARAAARPRTGPW